jgi:rhamnosyl/mannosyltransferase
MDELHRDPQRARQMGVNARRRYEDLFTGRRMGERYADAYRRILAARASGESA